MAGLAFCLNRRQGTVSTAVVYGNELKPGYRVQIREKRVYGQIWEGVVDGDQLCEKFGDLSAFLSLKALLNVPADCSDSPGGHTPPVGSGNPNVLPTVVDPPAPDIPVPPIPDPPMMSCAGQLPSDGMVDVIIADYTGNVVSCNGCSAVLFP